MRDNTLTHYKTLYHNSTVISNNEEITNYFNHLKASNCGSWFEAFLKFTNQKSITASIIQSLFGKLRKHDILPSPISILDVGCGEGELALKILQTREKDLSSTTYYGIDNESKFVNIIGKALEDMGVKHQLKEGNCFSDDLNYLPDDADVILASNVAYYAPHIESFVNSLLSKRKPSGILLSIHESSYSVPNSLRKKYGAEVDTKTSYKISTHLQNLQLRFYEFEINSKITLPKDYLILAEELTSVMSATRDNTHTLASDLHQFKMLAEFIVQTPLELLQYKGLLQDYMHDILSLAQGNNGSLNVSSSVVLVIPDSIYEKVGKVLNYNFLSEAKEKAFAIGS